jgi:plasmid replication initiation protein
MAGYYTLSEGLMDEFNKQELQSWLDDGLPRKAKRIVKEHDSLVRVGRYSLSAMGQKLLIYGFSLLPDVRPGMEKDQRAVKFSYTEFCRAMGINKGGSHLEEFVQGIDNLMRAVIYLPKTDNPLDTDINEYHWCTVVGYDKSETGYAYLVFSPDLINRLLDSKYFYTPLLLEEVGKLKGEYAIRHYENVRSHETLVGKYGNSKGKWKYEYSLIELRLIFGIESIKYQNNKDFFKRVVEGPVDELNKADFNFTAEVERIKNGRVLAGVRINCAYRDGAGPRKAAQKTLPGL